MAREAPDRVIFFGGTALGRTHLPEGRLSEDLDFLAVGSRAEVAQLLERQLATGVRREYGRLTWTPALTATRGSGSAVLSTEDGLVVRVQLMAPEGYPQWPTEPRDIVQRYSDAPPARLTVPTRPAFVAWKTAAWAERGAPRDLYDLWCLAESGAIDAEALELYVRHGPTGHRPAEHLFEVPPTVEDWRVQLGGQARLVVGPQEAADRVRAAWRESTTER